MIFRTDLAVEALKEQVPGLPEGILNEEFQSGSASISRITIQNDKGAKALGKPIGQYITVEMPPFSESSNDIDDRIEAVAKELSRLLPPEGEVLVAGLGNSSITPDALGPKTARKVLATRHIQGEFARASGLDHLRSVSVVAPGVLGQTGIETGELLCGILEKTRPAAVIAVDALASRSLDRLGCTVQLSNTGISPGAGVGNHRMKLNQETLGIPVIAAGVPTVVDALTVAADAAAGAGASEEDLQALRGQIEPRGEAMMVTPREIDLLIDHAAHLMALAINMALQPTLSPEDILSLTN